MSIAFNILSQTNTNEIDFISLQIHRSDKGTSIDQMYHNYKNILSLYFSPCHVTKIVDTPIRANPTNEADLANSIPLSPIELHHIEQWTCPGLNYVISLINFLKALIGSGI